MTGRPPLTLIAAVARNRVIGADNDLPWRLPTDLRHFKAATLGRPVLMGRRTYQSIGRPLPGRETIVLTTDPLFAPEGVRVAGSIAEALRIGAESAAALSASEIMVAGGGSLYEALIGRAARLRVTEVALSPRGDTLFPVIDVGLWRLTERVVPVRTPADEADIAFLTYERL